MKMCLAMFCGCSKEEYDVEVNRLVGFLETSGSSLRATFEQERERASEELDFERAAAIHKKLEKLDGAFARRPEVGGGFRPRRRDSATHGRRADIGIFGVRGGRLALPLLFVSEYQPATIG